MTKIKYYQKKLFCYWCETWEDYLIAEGSVVCKNCRRFINRKLECNE